MKMKTRIQLLVCALILFSSFIAMVVVSLESQPRAEKNFNCQNLLFEMDGESASDYLQFMRKRSSAISKLVNQPSEKIEPLSIDVGIEVASSMKDMTQCMLNSGNDYRFFLNSFKSGSFRELFQKSLRWVSSLEKIKKAQGEYLSCNEAPSGSCIVETDKFQSATNSSSRLFEKTEQTIQHLTQEYVQNGKMESIEKRTTKNCSYDHSKMIEAAKNFGKKVDQAAILFELDRIKLIEGGVKARSLAKEIDEASEMISCIPFVIDVTNKTSREINHIFSRTHSIRLFNDKLKQLAAKIEGLNNCRDNDHSLCENKSKAFHREYLNVFSIGSSRETIDKDSIELVNTLKDQHH